MDEETGKVGCQGESAAVAECHGDAAKGREGPRGPSRKGGGIVVALFMMAVPAAIVGGAYLLKHQGGAAPAPSAAATSPGGGPPEAGRPSDAAGKMEYVGPDAPLTPIEPYRSILAPEGADEPMALERWPEGGPKTTSREWSHDGSAMEEMCWFARDGSPMGCGLLKDGERWEGVFAKWSTPMGKLSRDASVLRELVSYRDGKKDGVARAYRYDGAPSVETFFKADEQVRRRVFRHQENQVVDLGSMRVTGLPESRRTRNTKE